MNTSEVNHLVKMINQISINIKSGLTEDEAKRKVLKHIELFWSPSMRKKAALSIYECQGELDPIALSVLTDIQKQYA